MAGNFLDALEMDEILAQLLGRDQLWRALEMLSPLANTGQVGLLGSRGDRQEFEILGEGV